MPSPDETRFLVLAAIVMLAFATEAATGFGATVITLALAVSLIPIDAVLPVIVPLNLAMSVWIVTRERAHLDRALLWRRILPLMGAGLVVGLALFEGASVASLQRAFGAFVVVVAAEGLWRLRGGANGEDTGTSATPLSPPVRGAAILGAGVIHGLFASGGPLLVWALGRSSLAKRGFRATLQGVWLVLGAGLVAAYAVRGRLDAASLTASAALLPVVALAVALGDFAHHRLDELRFRRVVFALLLVAGATSLF
jgi:uncharacterized membrane protein YfcA